MHDFRTYIFCQSLHTLQRGLSPIADLLVKFLQLLHSARNLQQNPRQIAHRTLHM